MINNMTNTELIKEINEKYESIVNRHNIQRTITPDYLDDGYFMPITQDEEIYLKCVFLTIKSRGENINFYTKQELFQVNAFITVAVELKRTDLIRNCGFSSVFISNVKRKTAERLL